MTVCFFHYQQQRAQVLLSSLGSFSFIARMSGTIKINRAPEFQKQHLYIQRAEKIPKLSRDSLEVTKYLMCKLVKNRVWRIKDSKQEIQCHLSSLRTLVKATTLCQSTLSKLTMKRKDCFSLYILM